MKATKLDKMLDNVRPDKLAKIAAYISSLIDTESDEDEFKTLSSISNAAFNAGDRNQGDEFVPVYFDAVIAVS